MTTAEIYESYGFKAHSHGFFQQWRMETSSVVTDDPTIDRAEAARKTYERLHRQKVAERKIQEKLSK
jgi:hypothetical protein